MKYSKHFLTCDAPLCIANKDKNWEKKVIWIPGEKVCDKHPLTHLQKNQMEINNRVKKGDRKYKDRIFTATELNRIKFKKKLHS